MSAGSPKSPLNGSITDHVFALLDDSDATTSIPRSRLYTGFVKALVCRHAGQFDPMLAAMRQALETDLYAVGVFAYELGAQLKDDPCAIAQAGAGAQADTDNSSFAQQPLAQILLFTHCQHLSGDQATQWLAQRATFETHVDADEPCAAGVANILPEIDESAFTTALEHIHRYITAGDVYQVNYTYRLRFDVYGSVVALYRQLRQRQPVPFGALIALPDGAAVLSFSPELFVSHVDGKLTARPMKGTAAASGNGSRDGGGDGAHEADAERATALASDEKNRAENLMIVDLLRNDLGRIACTGSVSVPSLFDVAAYGSVLQMTSTVCATLRPEVTLPAVFAALFPCGSITGAPKRRSMQIIDEIETSPRGIYTGAIGWFDRSPNPDRVGNFMLSVPIRTLLIDAPDDDNLRRGALGVGAGIVHDSRAAQEYQECQLKARFLTDAPPAFELFETLYATREDGFRNLGLHLQRLQNSAACFGFVHDTRTVRGALETVRLDLAPGKPYRVRLTLGFDGACTVRSTPLDAIEPIVNMLMANEAITLDKLLLRHKITLRAQYDRAWRMAEAQGAFDVLFQNAAGELTEGARSNLFLRLDGRWYTPPLDAGVLPGVMRSLLLADPSWAVVERRLLPTDLARAEKIVLCNALRGTLEARVVEPVAGLGVINS